MKQVLFISILFLYGSMLRAQDLVSTPTSLIVIFNYPGNYFYLELEGKDKHKTLKKNVFYIDSQLIQVKALIQTQFIKDKNDDLPFSVFIKNYVSSENDFAKHKFSNITNSKLEILKSGKGRDIGFWTYDVISNQQKGKTDSILINQAKKQLFIFTRVKKYLVGINCPLHDTTKFDYLKNYLIANIDGIVESPDKIDGIKLYYEKNK